MQTMSGRAAIKKINKLIEIFWLVIPMYVMTEAYHLEAFNSGSVLPIIPNQSI